MRSEAAPHRFFLAVVLVALAGCRSAEEVGRHDAPDHTTPTAEDRLDVEAEFEEFEEFEESEEFDEFEEFEDSEEAEEIFDPLSAYNRVMFLFNDKFYLWFWKGVA